MKKRLPLIRTTIVLTLLVLFIIPFRSFLLSQNTNNNALTVRHSMLLTGLSVSTAYYNKATSANITRNNAPATGDPVASNFNLPPVPPCAQDQLAADFSLGVPDANTLVALTGDGAVILKPSLNQEFSGTILPLGWTSANFAGNGTTTVASGSVTVNGTHIFSNSSFAVGSSLEFVATYNSGTSQNVGLSIDQPFNGAPWVTIGQGGTANGNLYARTSANTAGVLLGSNLLGSTHRFRIQWNTTNFTFYVDGNTTPAATLAISPAPTAPMYVQISDFNTGDGMLSVDWLRVTPYPASGSYTSRVFDQGAAAPWGASTWNASVPTGTSLSVFVSTGNTVVPDATWSPFVAVTNGGNVGGNARYLQYRADLATTNPFLTPELQDITVACNVVDNTPPVITSVLATPSTDGTSATITWATDELANTTVDYGTSASSLTDHITNASLVASHGINLTGLTPGTPYFFRVTSADGSSNSSTLPTPPALPFSFVTPLPPCFTDQVAADFAGGILTNTYIANKVDGEVTLKPSAGAEFTTLPPTAQWNSFAWPPANNGTSTISGGKLIVDGARFNAEPIATTFGPGSVLEFFATFAAAQFQHIGFGGGTDDINSGGIFNGTPSPWAMFSTGTGSTTLFARTSTDGSASTDVSLGSSLLGTPHLYRIEWTTVGTFKYYVDGALVNTDANVITSGMRPAVSDFTSGGATLQVDWIHVTPYATLGIFESRVYNAGSQRNWGNITWTGVTSSGETSPATTLALSVHTGNTAIPDDSWTTYAAIANNGAVGATSQYIQYKAALTTASDTTTPVLKDVSISCSAVSNSAPVVTTDPATQTVCNATNVSFTSAASGAPTPTVQWQVSTDNGSNWNNIGGATSATLSFVVASVDNGNQYRAVWTNSVSSVPSSAATLTVTTVTATIAAVNASVCQGDPVQINLTNASGQSPYSLTINSIIYNNVQVGQPFTVANTLENTIWANSATPATATANDGHPIEVGVKFRTSISGIIKGVRFYKGSANTGTHIGSLWTGTGIQLATAIFTNESASGWQEVRFNSPVAVTAGVTYVASYFSPAGGFAFDAGFFSSAGVTNGPLQALQSGVDGPNCVFQYDVTGFPATGNNANYWVDVIFEPTLASAQNATYNLTDIKDATNCETTGNPVSTTSVIINPVPIAFNVTGGGAYCSNDNGAPIGLDNSQSDVSYQLMQGASPVGDPVLGTGSSISFGNQSAAGTYTVVATSSGCNNNMTGSVTVSINQSPTVFNVTGGGGYCSGDAGVIVGLDNSETGVDYQLMKGANTVGDPVAGTGSPVSFGQQTAAGTYNVVATNTSTNCTSDMSGNAVISINPLPTVFNVTGGGGYCSGDAGVIVGLDNSETGVDYQLMKGANTVGDPVAGTGSAISFGQQTAAGTYNVVATNTTTNCTSDMSGNAVISINPLPTVFNVTGGGGYCSGDAGVIVGLDNSETGVDYQLMKGANTVGDPVAGTGSPVSFGQQTAAGTYNVVATNTSTNCTSDMSGNAVISINPLPTVFNVTGGGSDCSGGAAVKIGLSGSETGVNYQLMNGASTVGSPVPGTGSFITFGKQTVTGTYTVVATNDNGAGCSIPMKGSKSVIINPLPTAFNVTGGGGYCSGDAGVIVGLDNSETGVDYQLMKGANTVGGPVEGAGSAISFGNQAKGTYKVVATNGTGCSNTMTGSAVVTQPRTPPAKPSVISLVPVNNSTSLCGGGNFTFSITAVPNATSYNWIPVAGGSVVTNNGINAVINIPSNFSTGTLQVIAVNDCGSSAAKNLKLTSQPPAITDISGQTTVQSGQTDLVYSIVNPDPLVTYTWILPGSVTKTGQTLTSVTVTWGNIAGTIKATGTTSCGKTPKASLPVAIGTPIISNPKLGLYADITMTIAPNPAESKAWISFTAHKEGKYVIEVTDVLGKVLILKEGMAIKGANQAEIDISNKPNAVYFVTLVNKEIGRKTMKLIKAK